MGEQSLILSIYAISISKAHISLFLVSSLSFLSLLCTSLSERHFTHSCHVLLSNLFVFNGSLLKQDCCYYSQSMCDKYKIKYCDLSGSHHSYNYHTIIVYDCQTSRSFNSTLIAINCITLFNRSQKCSSNLVKYVFYKSGNQF